MKPIRKHTGICLPLPVDNVDTDQIIPSREMTRVSKLGLGSGLFAGWRYRYDGKEKIGLNNDFVLNQPAFRGASILLGGRNFGCGSSREHAVWALHDYGFRVLIAESFGRIFRNNCARNGVLAIDLPESDIDVLHAAIAGDDKRLGVDLEAGTVETGDGRKIAFTIAESDRHMLLEGLDYIDYTLQFERDIDAFRDRYHSARRWARIDSPPAD